MDYEILKYVKSDNVFDDAYMMRFYNEFKDVVIVPQLGEQIQNNEGKEIIPQVVEQFQMAEINAMEILKISISL